MDLNFVRIPSGSRASGREVANQALKEPVEQAQAYVQQQPAINLDETGWQELTANFWLWVATTPAVTVFRVFQTRGAQGSEQLLAKNLLRCCQLFTACDAYMLLYPTERLPFVFIFYK
jgi:hypothetical protein